MDYPANSTDGTNAIPKGRQVDFVILIHQQCEGNS